MHKHPLCKSLFFMLLLAALLCLSAVPALAAEQGKTKYSDSVGHWAEAAIQRWSDEEVILGFEGLFRPDDSITRGEMALILDRVLRYATQAANNFSDLPNDTWYTEAVLKLNAAGVMLGYQDLARPLDSITREEAVVMICRAVGMDGLVSGTETSYADDADISDWAAAAVFLFSERGFITDSPTVFRPGDAITRAEMVVILDNLVGELWRADGLYNEDVSGNALIASEQIMFFHSIIEGDLIIAGGSTKKVILEDVTVLGQIINKSNAEIVQIAPGETNTGSIFFGNKELPVQQGVPVNPYAGRDFHMQSGRLIYDAGYFAAGIDVSEWQEEIDWQAVARDGIEFAIIRVGYRGYSEGKISIDKYFFENMDGALDAGLDVGVYFYSQAINEQEAIEEAQTVLTMLQGYDISYPVVYDWESAGVDTARTNNLSGDTLTRCAAAFCETIAASGYQPCVYFYSKLAYEEYNLAQLSQYPFWWAGYREKPEFYYNYDIWQYTSSGVVNGVKTRVDMNISFIPY